MFLTERSKVEINENKKKTFKIGEMNYINEGLNILHKKKIVDSKINQNSLLFFEEIEENVISQVYKKNIYEFIQNE